MSKQFQQTNPTKQNIDLAVKGKTLNFVVEINSKS